MPINYMERVVDLLLPSILEKYENICTCEKCVKDIKAIALNHLPPRYVVTDQGKFYIKLNEMDPQFIIDVTKEIIDAIHTVSKQPRHDL